MSNIIRNSGEEDYMDHQCGKVPVDHMVTHQFGSWRIIGAKLNPTTNIIYCPWCAEKLPIE